ncbi:MAG TPA: tetratricopeptide repeat protein [Vicinamibacterales bacterium]|nr:tetratricopeptide repeat protein [Vicinamibacterales bacterium]
MKRVGLVMFVVILWSTNSFAQSAPAVPDIAPLERAVQESPQDANVHVQLSQGYAMVDRPLQALEAMEHAVAISPDSVDFLRARATLATWAGDYARARDSYRRLAKLQPDDHDVALNFARVNAWSGRTDAAVDAYKQYLRAKPDSPSGWIELARSEMWRGNYAAALDNLDTYQDRFGNDDACTRERAAVLARAGRPREALDILEPLFRAHADDYELTLTRTIALTADRRTREASQAFDALRQLQPDSSDTRSVERTVRNALGSTADPGVNLYRDSSTLEILRVEPRATMVFASGTALSGGFEHEQLRADKGSGLEQIDGTESARHDQIWIGAAHPFAGVNLRGRVGQSRTAIDSLTAYAIGADVMPFDGLTLSVERSSGLFVVSPRTVGLGLHQVSHSGRVEWSPTLRLVVAGNVRSQTLSDNNRRWEFTLQPRYSVARTERLNLDLGAVVGHLSTRTNYDNGYYDPSRYQYYGFTAYPYWKMRENVGLGMSLGLGAQRDDFSPAFRPGGNASAEATFGIFKPWALKVSGGGIFNQRLGSGAFGGYSASVSVIRKFSFTSSAAR